MKIRDYVSFDRFRSDPTDTVEQEAERAWRWSFMLGSIAFFFGLLALFIYISTVGGLLFAQVLAAVAAGLMLRAILPAGRFQEWSKSYATGEAGNRWRRRVEATGGWIKTRLHRTLSILPRVSGPD